MVHIKSVEEYEDEEYHDYSDDDIFEATTFHPNSVLPADAMDKASLFKDLIIKLAKCSTRLCRHHILFYFVLQEKSLSVTLVTVTQYRAIWLQ